MPRYVPPALRKKSAAEQGVLDAPSSDLEARNSSNLDADKEAPSRSLADLTTSQSKKKKSRRNQLYTAREVRNHFWPFSDDPCPDSQPTSKVSTDDRDEPEDTLTPEDTHESNNHKPSAAFPTTTAEEHEEHATLDSAHSKPDPSSPWRERLPPSTLNNSVTVPDSLAYVMLFPGANPRWDSDRLVFAKSNLEVLPRGDGEGEWTNQELFVAERAGHAWALDGAEAHTANAGRREPLVDYDTSDEESDEAVKDLRNGSSTTASLTTATVTITPRATPFPAPNDAPKSFEHRAIPVFQQQHRGHRAFRFAGHWHVRRIAYLAPHTGDLVRMLEQKFTGYKQRTGDAWQASLRHSWAIVQLVPLPVLTRAPKIEVGGCETDEELARFKAQREQRRALKAVPGGRGRGDGIWARTPDRELETSNGEGLAT